MLHRVAILLCVLASLAAAKTTLDIDPGFNGRFRAGRWSPVYITVRSDKPHTADLSLHVPNASGSAMTLHQTIGVGTEKQTYVLYAPLTMMDDPLRATLTDHESGVPLAHWPEDPSGGNSRFGLGGEQIGFLAVSSGRSPMMAGFTRSNVTGPTLVTHLRPALLPATAAGYDSLDLLALNHPDLENLSTEQQTALLDWLRSGGTLLIWPGPEPLPTCPLVDALPAEIGDNATLTLTPDQRSAFGLADRFASIGSRTLAPREGSARIDLLDHATAAIAGQLGLGRIIVLPIDASTLQFGSVEQSNDFWNALLDPFYPLKQATPNTYYNPSDIAATQAALDRIGQIQGVGVFGFSYVVVLIGAMMVLVGPVDYLVLKKIGRQPWTWTTTAGWIGLFTAGGLYAGHLFQSGDLHFRTLQLFDQADGRIVGSNEVALIYAPRSADYTIAAQPGSWWQPVPSGTRYGGEGFAAPIDLTQDYRGTTPSQVWIDVWNFQFLQGRTYADAPPWVEAQLSRSGDAIHGTVKNLLDRPLKDVQVSLSGYETQSVGDMQAGQSLDVQFTAKPFKADPKARNFYPGGADATSIAGESAEQRLFDIDPVRASAAARPALPGGGESVQLIAQSDGAVPDLALPNTRPVEKHSAIYRATIRLQP